MPDIILSFDTVDVLNINFISLMIFFFINAVALSRGDFLLCFHLFKAGCESRGEKTDWQPKSMWILAR